MLFVWAESNRRYDEQDLALAEELARRAAIALENARIYRAEQATRQAAEQLSERMASLQAITAALSGALTPSQVAEAIIEQGLPALEAAGGVITLIDEAKTELSVLHFGGYSPKQAATWGRRFPMSIPVPLTDTVRSGQPIFVESPAELEARYPALARHRVSNYQAFVALPLSIEDNIIGGIGLSFVEPRSFSLEEQVFMLTLARQCAQALERARLYEAERQARTQAEAAQQSLALLAEARERNRLAQELHDNVAQALGYVNLKITLTHNLLAANRHDEVLDNLRELKQIVGEAYTDIRGEIFNLRANPSTDIDFLATLRRYIDKYHRFYRLTIDLVLEADEAAFDFPGQIAVPLIRTVQEALINIRKHAQVDQALIRLQREGESVRIIIEDEGQGFDPTTEKAHSFGLKIMRERVESVGGHLEIDSAPGQGTRIILFFSYS